MTEPGRDSRLSYAGPSGRAVQTMFANIAHRYDFLNRFLSVSIDRYWRKSAVDKVRSLTGASDLVQCLDLCAGTGDLALDLHRRLGIRVVAADFCHPMLIRSLFKTRARGLEHFVRTVEADTLALPFADQSFGAVTVAFGLRNLEDPKRGLEEMRRVLAARGALVVLEFSRPVAPVFRHAFNLYFRHVLPKLGAVISGDGEAYRYLPESVQKFPAQEDLAELLRRVGFSDVGYRNLTGGVAALHWGRKA